MKSSRNELEQRYLLLFKIDAQNLFERIYERRHDYIEAFSLKRNRGIFKDVFENRYQKASINDLSHCPTEVIEALNQFYKNADNLFWYLKHTQDMPNTIEDEVQRKVNKLRRDFDMLCLYVDAELSGEASHSEENETILGDDGEPFQMEGELQEQAAAEEYLQPETYPDFFETDSEDESEFDTNNN